MKKLIIAAILVLVLLLLGCSQQQASTPVRTMPVQQQMPPAQDVQQAPAQAQTASEASVDIKGFAFNPATVTIKTGGAVTWTQKDPTKHTISADDSSFESPLLGNGESWSRTFDTPGTYTYHCSPHPNMKGTIIVE